MRNIRLKHWNMIHILYIYRAGPAAAMLYYNPDHDSCRYLYIYIYIIVADFNRTSDRLVLHLNNTHY